MLNKEEKEAIEYYKDKEISFTVDYDTEELLKALGITETEEDSFENHQIRFRTIFNLIQKQQRQIKQLETEKQKVIDELEEDIKVNQINYKTNTDGFEEYWRGCLDTEIEILSILKGEDI